MYESPIVLMEKVDKISKDFGEKLEDHVVEVIRSYYVDVDKEELLKALEYDRDQYDKGFKDGFEKAKKEMESKPLNNCRVRTDEEEEKVRKWCRANCFPGSLCPDTYCIEAWKGALREEVK